MRSKRSLKDLKIRSGKFDTVLEGLYGQLFRAQILKEWDRVDRIQKVIRKYEEGEGQVEQNQEGLRD